MRFLHVTVQTAAFEEEIRFYETYAGLTIRRDMRSMGRDLVFLSDAEGDTEVEIIRNPEAEKTGNDGFSMGFRAEGPEAVRQRLADDGFEVTPFISPAPDVRFFFARDPAGLQVQFMRVPPAGPDAGNAA